MRELQDNMVIFSVEIFLIVFNDDIYSSRSLGLVWSAILFIR